jgi:hypothetical protein
VGWNHRRVWAELRTEDCRIDRPKVERSLIDAYIIPALRYSAFAIYYTIQETYGDSSPRLFAHPVLE